MFGTVHLAAFIIAGIGLNLYPGPDTMYIISRSISQGRRAGIMSVLGISTGGLIHTALAGLGLSSILTASVKIFYLVKCIGAGYLIYLGIMFLITKKSAAENNTRLSRQTNFRIYKQGLLINLLNPKVALFFLSFLPQFVDPNNNRGVLSFLFLGSIFITTGTIWCFVIAIFSSGISRRLKRNKKINIIFEKLAGIVYIGLGLNLLRERIQ